MKHKIVFMKEKDVFKLQKLIVPIECVLDFLTAEEELKLRQMTAPCGLAMQVSKDLLNEVLRIAEANEILIYDVL